MKILSYIAIFFTIIILGSFFWTSGCFGVYEEPVWFESFEEFPANGINLKLYSDYTENPYDAFYISYDKETDWQSYIYNSTDGNYSIKLENWGLNLPTDFNWVPGILLFDYEVETGGELFFDYYVSEDFSNLETGFSFTYETMEGQHIPYSFMGIPNSIFNRGEWNSIEMEWYWNAFGDGNFIYGLFVNDNWVGLNYGSATQGNVSGFIMGSGGTQVPLGYILVDNFKMYTSIDIVDPEEPPPEEYDFAIWADYYNSISEKFTTSTPLFNSIAESFSPIIDKMGDYTLYVKEYFDLSEATAKGTALGLAIPIARGYLMVIDDFIGLPLTGLVLFYILTMAVVISYKVILAIIKLLKP